MRPSIVTAAALIAASLATAHAAGMIDRLKAGDLQCYGPDAAKHSCAALSGYSFAGDTIMNRATVLISPNPVGTMTTDSPVTLKGEAICGKPSKTDIDASIITSEGQVLSEAQAAGVKAQIWSNIAPSAGMEMCTTYEPVGAAFTTRYTLDGKPYNIPSTTVILVGPKDGWHVAP